MIAHVLGVSRSGLVAVTHDVDEAQIWPLVERRARREPLAYVLGEWAFRRLTLQCDPRALVPRPETEVVVDRCLDLLGVSGSERQTVLDVGTGTGAIALALADEADARVVAIDSSADALELARENARRNGVEVQFVHGDLHDGLPRGPFDLVVSNPPYVLPAEWNSLPPEVRDWEPKDALVDKGQTAVLIAAAPDALRSGAHLVVEVHEARARAIADQLADAGYVDVTITRDLAGRERIVEGTRS